MFIELFVCIDYCFNEIWVILTHYSSYTDIPIIYIYCLPSFWNIIYMYIKMYNSVSCFCDCFLFQSCSCVLQIHFHRPICWALYEFSFLITITEFFMVIDGRRVWAQHSENTHSSGEELHRFSLYVHYHSLLYEPACLTWLPSASYFSSRKWED